MKIELYLLSFTTPAPLSYPSTNPSHVEVFDSSRKLHILLMNSKHILA